MPIRVVHVQVIPAAVRYGRGSRSIPVLTERTDGQMLQGLAATARPDREARHGAVGAQRH